MKLATKSVSFIFHDTMYCQIDRISMGSPLSPLIANVFVGSLEQQLFPLQFCYFHYVDTFACFSSHSEALKFFHCFNSLYSLLSFTMEEENNNMLPFPDGLVERNYSFFTTSVYTKPTFTGLFMSWDSSAHTSRNINLVRCLTYRALMICSDGRIENEIRKVTHIFSKMDTQTILYQIVSDQQ